jgi:hypothetical protein
MSLFGGSVKRAPRPQSEVQQFEAAEQMRGTAAAFEPLLRMRLADTANPAREIALAQGRSNADAAQSMVPLSRASTPFQRAMTRTRGLSRIAMAGDHAVRMQTFRDRAALAGFGQGVQSGNMRTLGDLSQMFASTDAARMRADQTVGAARANMYGSFAGLAAGGLSGANWSGMFGPRAVGGTGTGMGVTAPVMTLDQIGYGSRLA